MAILDKAIQIPVAIQVTDSAGHTSLPQARAEPDTLLTILRFLPKAQRMAATGIVLQASYSLI